MNPARTLLTQQASAVPPMTTPAIWELIRAGVLPDDTSVAEVASIESAPLGSGVIARRVDELRTSVLGLGPLDVLLDDVSVTDILVNGIRGVWVDRGQGSEPVPGLAMGDEEDVRRLAVRLAGLAGRRLDDSAPYVDGLLPGGVRLHALLPPLVEDGPHISLRVPRVSAPSLEGLATGGSLDAVGLSVLQGIVRARLSVLITGGTGAGKTTVLAAMLTEIPPNQRIVLVEDVRELPVVHPHVVRMQARSANVEGRGAVPMVVLVRQALRMRPDRLVVGEVRGAEIRDMLAALNTGHDGGCATIHANGISDVVSRCEALGALAGLDAPALRRQLSSAVQVVVHVRRRGPLREVAQVGVLVPRGEDLNVVAAWTRGRTVGEDPGWDRLAALLDGGAP